jgi:hypothetical protein
MDKNLIIVVHKDDSKNINTTNDVYCKRFEEEASGNYCWIRIVNEYTLNKILKQAPPNFYTKYYPTTKAIMCLFVVYCEIPTTYFKKWQDNGLIVDIQQHVENESSDTDSKSDDSESDDSESDDFESLDNDGRYGTIIVQFNTIDIDIKAAQKDFVYSELHFFIIN